MYFTEFTFCYNDQPDTAYWFPILIDTPKSDKAEVVRNRIGSLLAGKFALVQSHDLRMYERPFYSEVLTPLVETQQKVEILKLNLKALTIVPFQEALGIRLNAQYQIVPQTLMEGHRHTITSKLKRSGFLTTQFHYEPDYGKEFIVMKYKSNDSM